MIDGNEVAKMVIKAQLKRYFPWITLAGIVIVTLAGSWKYQKQLHDNPMIGAVIAYVFLPIVFWAVFKIHELNKEEEPVYTPSKDTVVVRMGNVQEILMQMSSSLLMTHVAQIRKESPGIVDSQIISKMIKSAYEESSCNDKVMALNYQETVYLEMELKRMCQRSIEFHNLFLETNRETA